MVYALEESDKQKVKACRNILERINKTNLKTFQMLLLSYIRWAKYPSKLPAENNDPKFLLDATLIAKHFLNHELRLQYSLISYISKWYLWVSFFFVACWQITWKVKYLIILFRAVPRRQHKILWQAHSLPVSYSHAENSMEWIKANPLVQSNPLKSRMYYCTSLS